MITNKDLAIELNVEIYIIRRWQRLGLIPASRLTSLPTGRGRQGVLPDWTVQRGKQILSLLESGYGVKLIQKLFNPFFGEE